MNFILQNINDINVKDNTGRTALLVAAQYGPWGIAQFLLEKGADPDIPDDQGNTVRQIFLSQNVPNERMRAYLFSKGSVP